MMVKQGQGLEKGDPEPDVHSRSAAMKIRRAAPRQSGHALERAHLSDRVLAAAATPLILLHAPAGFGKTTLMLEMRRRLEREGVPTAWLTMDSSDSDVGCFLPALEAALAPLVPGIATARNGRTGPGGLALGLLDAVALHQAPFALFLDDFESAQGGEVPGLVRELIGSLPEGARVVIGSRNIPDLGIGRLRVCGRLIEVEQAHLRFTIEETESYLKDLRGLHLTSQDVSRLHRSTEGWAAALWIAAHSLENRPDPGRFIAGFTGSNFAIVEYLLEDVLSRQDERTRRFLLRTSIVRDLVPSLCDRLCNRSDSLDMLQRLEREHLFLVPIQTGIVSWRYHSMFAAFLRLQLERRSPAFLPELHCVAAGWYLDQDRKVPAIEHLLAAGNTRIALRLLSREAVSLLQQGRLRLLARWLDPLLERGLLEGRFRLQLVHAWAGVLARGALVAGPLLERLDRRKTSSTVFDTHRRALRLLHLVLLDRTEEASAAATTLAAEISGHPTLVHSFVEIVLANLRMIEGHYREALRLAHSARSRSQYQTSSFMLGLSEAVEGAIALAQGRLSSAIVQLRLAVETGAENTSDATNGNAMAGVLLAMALYEADHTDQAQRLLNIYIPLIRAVGIPDQLIVSHTIMARIAIRRGDHDRARQVLAELELAGQRSGLGRVVASSRLERARIMTIQGRLNEARAEIDRCSDHMVWTRVSRLCLHANDVEDHELAQARLSVAGAYPEAFVDRLRTDIDAAERAQRARRALTLRLVLVQGYYRGGHRNKAMRILAQAVRFAASENYVAALRDEGPTLLAMLRELRDSPALPGDDLSSGASFLAFIDKVLERDMPLPQAGMPANAEPAIPDIAASDREALTRKELRVLALAAEGLTNHQLAQRVFVAETTVRTHLRSINAKLRTRSRTEAIAVARRSGLLA